MQSSFGLLLEKNKKYKSLKLKTFRAVFKFSLKNIDFLLAGLKNPCIFAAAYRDNESCQPGESSFKMWIERGFWKLIRGIEKNKIFFLPQRKSIVYLHPQKQRAIVLLRLKNHLAIFQRFYLDVKEKQLYICSRFDSKEFTKYTEKKSRVGK